MQFHSEEELANFFLKAVEATSISGIPSYFKIEREVACRQGISDFIALRKVTDASVLEKLGLCTRPKVSSCILALLKEGAPRTKDYLLKAAGYTTACVRQVIDELIGLGLIAEIAQNRYVSCIANTVREMEIWSFEAKMSDWKRAVFQSAQHNIFATYSYTVFPSDKEALIRSKETLFRHYRVGAITCEADSNSAVLIKGKRNRSISLEDKYYVLCKMHSIRNSD